jgi:hypothetical protein
MKTRVIIATSFITTVIVLIVAIAVFALASPTMAQTPPANQVPSQVDARLALPAGGGGNFWSVAGSTFVNIYSGFETSYGAGGCLYHSSGTGGAYFNAPVTLPYASTITSVRFYYYDNTDLYDSTLELREYDYSGAYTSLLSLSSSGKPGYSFIDSALLSLPVNYSANNYVLHYSDNYIGASMRLCGVRIGYTPPGIFGAALPIIQK